MDRRAGRLTACVVLVSCLLLAGGAQAAEEELELWEEFIPARAPLRTQLVGRFPSVGTCESRARQLSDTPAPASVRRLGYMCLPAMPPRSSRPSPSAGRP